MHFQIQILNKLLFHQEFHKYVKKLFLNAKIFKSIESNMNVVRV